MQDEWRLAQFLGRASSRATPRLGLLRICRLCCGMPLSGDVHDEVSAQNEQKPQGTGAWPALARDGPRRVAKVRRSPCTRSKLAQIAPVYLPILGKFVVNGGTFDRRNWNASDAGKPQQRPISRGCASPRRACPTTTRFTSQLTFDLKQIISFIMIIRYNQFAHSGPSSASTTRLKNGREEVGRPGRLGRRDALREAGGDYPADRAAGRLGGRFILGVDKRIICNMMRAVGN